MGDVHGNMLVAAYAHAHPSLPSFFSMLFIGVV